MVFTGIPFGISPAPAFASAISAEIRQILIHEGIPSNFVHVYIDDFIIVGNNEAECTRYLDIALKVFESLNIPIAPDKVEPPAQVVEILGITVDTVRQVVYLSESKCRRLINKLHRSLQAQTLSKQNMQSVI